MRMSMPCPTSAATICSRIADQSPANETSHSGGRAGTGRCTLGSQAVGRKWTLRMPRAA